MSRRKNQRGAAMITFGLWMSAFMGFAAVAIDLSRLSFTASEVQSLADVAATAGATSLFRDGADPKADAQAVASANQVDGQAASISANDIELGVYDDKTFAFTPSGKAGANAVRATARATVRNMLASIAGSPTSTVERRAIAVMHGAGTALPPLPIALGDCNFAQYSVDGACASLPSFAQAPSGSDNTGWTSLGSSSAGASTVLSFLPTACGGANAPPTVKVNDSINVMNGSATTVLQAIATCLTLGINTFTIPVVPCGNYSGPMQVEGFATVVVNSVTASGSNKGLSLKALCNPNKMGPGGGGNFGTGAVGLVQ